jgi:tRNA G18 (ribose-2'-O)-methylase SpoU
MVIVEITDLSDPRLEEYRELTDPEARSRREGDEFFMIEGPTAISRAIQSPYRLRSVLLTTTKWERHRHELEPLDIPIYVVSVDLLEAVTGFRLHRGMIASGTRAPVPDLPEALAQIPRSQPLTTVLTEGLNDPENLGAIARTCRAFGVDQLWLDPTCIDPLYRRTVRVSMGEILHLPVGRSRHWPGDLELIRSVGIEVLALTPDPEAEDLWDIEIGAHVCLMVGAEGPGLSARALAGATRKVRIPISPGVDSLNVGAATAVACAELARRRRNPAQ